MKIAVLGTGMVGQTIAAKLNALGHEVTIGTRNVAHALNNNKPNPAGQIFSQWLAENPLIKLGSFAEAAATAALLINATSGSGSIEALTAAGTENLKGKTILDIANPLDFSQGMPPSLFINNTDSLGETLQRSFPEAHIVKSLNTMNCSVMVDPSLIPSDHNAFLSGNEASAKEQVRQLLIAFGWKSDNIIDLGDITTARGTEQLLPIWIRLWGALKTPNFNFHIAVAK
ncbi:MAG TPA: NAD(P)-binding domain-containing protein [Saprospiraceae bacterium]|nr:NAD(P)-binding domain-containing protein [Saprospiraceae bacterium]HMQ84763.1 NAD(P)-binding domain-containing protein [Saprospiraceae bacterium]